MAEKKILVIDSGGSGIRAMVFNDQGQIVAREYEKTPHSSPEPGAVEHDPEVLWQALLSVTKRLIAGQKESSKDIVAMGICNQRASFVLWEKATGKPLTKLISWADTRAAKKCDAINHDPKWLRLKALAKFAGALTGKVMYQCSGMLNFTTDYTLVRLKWVLDNDPGLQARCKAGEIRFGTLDTWFIHKLTGGKVHATDVTNAGAAGGLYNPFDLKWNDIYLDLFDIDASLFPEVKDSNGDFGTTDPAAFIGLSIPIRAAAGDQMAALFGQRCFEPGAVKISQGSGAFVDLNVGPKPKLSKRGLLPMVSWRINGKVNYLLEGFVATAGTLIDWLGTGIGLSDTPKVLNELAADCTDTAGVTFVPANAGIRFPYFNPEARGCVFGLTLATHKKHVARAVLEGIALSLHEVISGMSIDTKVPITALKVDGGVSKSDILLQCLADFANITVMRAPEPDMTATGIAYLAGLGAGIWKDLDDLKKIEQKYQTFEPKMNETDRLKKLAEWKKAIHAVLDVYSPKK